MATGNVDDIRTRLRALLPAGWFPDAANSPNLEAVLQGAATGFTWVYAQIQFAKLQLRIATASGGFLDLAAYDYLGYKLPRLSGETDSAYRLRVKTEILRIRNTRQGLINVITDLTGRAPYLHEPWNPRDNGGYDVAGGYDAGGVGLPGPFGWGAQQADMPAQIGITVFRPTDGRIYTDAMAIAAVERVRTAGTVVWMQIAD